MDRFRKKNTDTENKPLDRLSKEEEEALIKELKEQAEGKTTKLNLKKEALVE